MDFFERCCGFRFRSSPLEVATGERNPQHQTIGAQQLTRQLRNFEDEDLKITPNW